MADPVVAPRPTGRTLVTETIEVTFHSPPASTEILFRYPVDFRTAAVRFDHVRVPVRHPSDMHEERSGDYQARRIGDEHCSSGVTTSTRSPARGALNRFDSHDELFWNVTGDRWEALIERATATVRAADQPCHVLRRAYGGPTRAADHTGRRPPSPPMSSPPAPLDCVRSRVIRCSPPELEAN